jgi:hypothetical protein
VETHSGGIQFIRLPLGLSFPALTCANISMGALPGFFGQDVGMEHTSCGSWQPSLGFTSGGYSENCFVSTVPKYGDDVFQTGRGVYEITFWMLLTQLTMWSTYFST